MEVQRADSAHQPVIDELLSRGWLRSLHWFESVDSTNSAARRHVDASPGRELPALFVADRQTAGRGRSDHNWWSPEGCLMLTLVISGHHIPPQVSEWNQLALVCGVAVADTVAKCVGSLECQLKWPNDVYLRGRKVAGILIESVRSVEKSSPPDWLIGVGLNVSLDWNHAPDDLRQRATCLTRETSIRQTTELVLLDLIEQLERWLVGWRQADLHWLDGWRERCLLTGKIVTLRIAPPHALSQTSPEILGRCEGVDAQGRLLVRNEAGVQALSVGEVVRWSS